jgi:hypothetical protein
MEATDSSETLVNFFKIQEQTLKKDVAASSETLVTRRDIPQDSNLHGHCHESDRRKLVCWPVCEDVWYSYIRTGKCILSRMYGIYVQGNVYFLGCMVYTYREMYTF